MGTKALYDLLIDNDFKRLHHVFVMKDTLTLTTDLMINGCLDPIIIWNGTIIDGHKRYEICKRENIVFEIENRDFKYKEQAISWICTTQLEKGDIKDELRKFLIGILYDNERKLNAIKMRSSRRYPKSISSERQNLDSLQQEALIRISQSYGVSTSTVLKYVTYSRALLRIEEQEKRLFEKIISGRMRVSQKNVLAISKLPGNRIKDIYVDSEIGFDKTLLLKDIDDSLVFTVTENKDPCANTITASVKDMPEFDPDAEIISLTLTIPSWESSLQRVNKQTDKTQVSDEARGNLKLSLFGLMSTIEDLLCNI